MHFGGLGGSRWSSLDTVLMTPNMTAAFTQSYTRLKYARPTGNKAIALIMQWTYCHRVTLCQTCQKVLFGSQATALNSQNIKCGVYFSKGGTDLEPSQRGAWAASCRWGWWGCTWSGRGRPRRWWLPGESGPADWCSTSPSLSWSGLTCWPAGGSRHMSQSQILRIAALQLMESTLIL